MKFTKCLLAIIIAASTSHQLAASTGGRIVKNINFGWRFMPGDRKGAEAVDFSDKDWTEINVPHDFQIHQPWVAPSPDEKADLDNPMANVKSRLSPRGFKDMGVGWYRRELTPDEAWKGKRVLLDFEGVLLVGDVFLNGERIGGTDYGYLGFEMDVTDKLKYGEPNIIAVRADTGTPENSLLVHRRRHISRRKSDSNRPEALLHAPSVTDNYPRGFGGALVGGDRGRAGHFFQDRQHTRSHQADGSERQGDI